jgi:hypothetical protein
MATTGLTVMAPAKARERLCYMNGALNALDLMKHHRRTMAQEQDYRAARRDVEEQRQKLLDGDDR